MSRSTSCSNAAFSAARVTAPVGVAAPDLVEARLAGPRRILERGLQHAEQVLDAVVERERVALDVEEEVVRRRLGQHEEAPIGNERAVLVALGIEELRLRDPLVLALDLDAGLLADALEGLAAHALEARRHRQLEDRELAAARDAAPLERRPLARRDPGDQATDRRPRGAGPCSGRPSGRRRSARPAPGRWP